MKKGKQIAAITAIVLLLLVFASPMYFALSGKEFKMEYFFAALLAALILPILIFAFLESVRIFGRKKEQTGEKENKKIKNIIFDVGKVLLIFDWKGLMDQFSFPEEKRKCIEAAIFESNLWNERDRGLYEESYYVNKMVELAPQYEADIREFMRRSPETIHKTTYALSWVKYLKKQGYHLYILSNYGTYMRDANLPMMDFLKYMNGVVFSCDAKELKPEEGMYRYLLDKYQLDPGECVFIDDRQENLDGAGKLGIHTVLFKDFKQAVKELDETCGVK